MRQLFSILLVFFGEIVHGQISQPALLGTVGWQEVKAVQPPEKLNTTVSRGKMIKEIFFDSSHDIISRKINGRTKLLKNGCIVPITASFRAKGEKIKKVIKEEAAPLLTRDNQEYNLDYTDRQHGFFGTNSQDMTEDNEHNIWIASDIGLIKYDGINYYCYNEKSNLPFKNALAVAFDNEERLWFSTDQGTFFIRRDSLFTLESSEVNFSETVCGRIIIDRHKQVWLCTSQKGAMRINGNQVSIFDTRSGLPLKNVTNVWVDKDESIVFLTDTSGLLIATQDKVISLFHGSPEVQQQIITSILEDENGLWVGGFACGLININPKDTVQYAPLGTYKERIYDIKKAPGGFWLAIFGRGVYYFNKEKHFFISENNGLQSRFPHYIFEDSFQNLWISDLFNGFSRLNESVMYIQPLGNNAIKTVINIARDSHNGEWIFTNGGGTLYKQGKNITLYSRFLDKKMPDLSIPNYGIVASDGTVWMGSYGSGIVQGGKDYFTLYEYKSKTEYAGIVMSACEGENNKIWFSTLNAGLILYDRTSFWHYTKNSGLPGNEVTRLFNDPSKKVYCGFYTGLRRFTDHTIETFTINGSPFKQQVLYYFSDNPYSSFIGTENNGLIMIYKDKAYSLSVKNGLASDKIINIIRSGDGKIWITTNKSVEYFVFDKDQVKEHKILNKTNGNYVATNETVLLDSTGSPYWPLLWPLNTKKVIYNPAFAHAVHAPYIRLESITLDDTPTEKKPVYSILPNQKLNLQYVVKYWGRENNLVLQHIMVSDRGDTSSWLIHSNGQVLISEMTPGKYKIYLKATDNGQDYVSGTFDLTVRNYWYNTWLFRILMISLLTGILIVYFRQKAKQQRFLNKLLSEKIDKQTEQLRKEKEELAASYRTINQQYREKDILLQEVNHRVKNNLQLMVAMLDMQLQDDLPAEAILAIENTANRMNAMALVHEMLYDDKKVGAISVKKYIQELVRYYAEMWARPYLPVHFELQIADMVLNLKPALSLGMIISELISNSFKHAFPDSTDPKITIQLTHKAETGEVQLTISDNGIGIQGGDQARNGLGTKLIDIFSRELNGKYSVNTKENYIFTLVFIISNLPDNHEYEENPYR